MKEVPPAAGKTTFTDSSLNVTVAGPSGVLNEIAASDPGGGFGRAASSRDSRIASKLEFEIVRTLSKPPSGSERHRSALLLFLFVGVEPDHDRVHLLEQREVERPQLR